MSQPPTGRATIARRAILVAGIVGMLCTPVLARVDSDWSPEPPPKRPWYRDRINELLVRFDVHPAAGKLGRGLGNVFTGWLELPLNIQRYMGPHDQATGLFTGIVVGLVRAVGRTGAGVYETATFFLPYPEHYEPILPPLEYFTEEGRDLFR